MGHPRFGGAAEHDPAQQGGDLDRQLPPADLRGLLELPGPGDGRIVVAAVVDGTGARKVLLLVSHQGGACYVGITPEKAEKVADMLRRNATAARSGLHLPGRPADDGEGGR